MLLELLVAAITTASPIQAPSPFTAPRAPRLPNDGHACLIIDRCSPEHCVLPVAPRAAPRPDGRRCARRPPPPRVRVVPVGSRR